MTEDLGKVLDEVAVKAASPTADTVAPREGTDEETPAQRVGRAYTEYEELRRADTTLTKEAAIDAVAKDLQDFERKALVDVIDGRGILRVPRGGYSGEDVEVA